MTKPEQLQPVPAKNRGGRPTVYVPEVAHAICSRIAAGESLRSICRDKDMPSEAAVRGWALDDYQGFGALFTRARQIQAGTFADELVEIADEVPPRGEDGRIDAGAVHHQRLRVDTRKWILSKILPKVYGDKLDVVTQNLGVQFVVVNTGVPRPVDPAALARLLGEPTT